jgi:chaperonin GroEL
MEPNKEITFSNEARLRIKAGIDKAANAVRPTLGVVGMSAIIEYPGLDPIECDDGVTILKNLKFKDHYEQLGLQKLRKAALRTSQEGGDGTATTTILTQTLVEAAFREIFNDSSRIREVKERLEKGLTEILGELSKIKRDVTEEEIEQIATISSLDPEIAKIIAEIIKDVGINGVITVEKGPKLGYFKEVVKGAKIDKGLISPWFINDFKAQSCVLEDVYIVLVDRKISTNPQVLNLLNTIGTGHDILFIADGIDGVALATLAANHQQKIADIACIPNPYSASRARDFLFDMAALTGATVISEEMGMKLEEADVKLCGRAEKVIVTKDSTIIIGGKSDENVLNTRIEVLKSEITDSISEYEKMILSERLARLTGGIGVIRVGAYTDTEFNAKKYKFNNAIASTQAALQEGIVAGGGVALAYLQIKEPLFRDMLFAPIKQMAENAGMEWYKVLGMVQEANKPLLNSNYGVNFMTKELVDMFEAGIIDPYKVLRLALESAVAITSSLVSIETAIVIIDEDVKQK